MLFAFWAIRPVKRTGVSFYSHRDDHRDCGDCNEVRKKIVTDLLFSIEALFEICGKKVERVKWPLHFLIIAICTILVTFGSHLYL